MSNPYCNWWKGPHGKECYNPSQCYCDCHKPRSWTERRIKQQITMHRNAIKVLKSTLEERSA